MKILNFSAASVLVSIVFGTFAASATVTFSDGTFNNSDWSITDVELNAGGLVTGTQIVIGGNPGSYRDVTTNLNAGADSTVYGFNQYVLGSYDPAVQGAIVSIDYGEDYICPNCVGQGQRSGAAILQGGEFFFSLGAGTTVLTGNAPQWTDFTANGILQDDFFSITTAGLKPDFSASGDEIFIGFYRANSNGASGNPCSPCQVGAIDNWFFRINTATDDVPEPATLGLLGFGLAGLGFASRRRRTS